MSPVDVLAEGKNKSSTMNDSKTAYCRLCAELKQKIELTDLQTDDTVCEEVLNKLTRLNCHLDLKENILPQTVCLNCLDRLHSAFNFVVAVQSAQLELVIIQSEKLKRVSSDSESVKCESPNDISNDDDSQTTSSSDGMLDDGTDSNNKLIDKEVSTVPQTVEQSNISQEGNQKKDVSDPGTTLEPKLTWSDYKWTCSYCEIQYSNLFELKTHSMEQHQTCNAFSCTDCKNRYLRFDNFIKHICKHRKYLKLTCLNCREEFKTVIGLNRHKFSHFGHKYKCDGCNTCFDSSKKLHTHMKMYYKNGSSRYLQRKPQSDDLVCPICNKKSKTKSSFYSHKLIHTERKREYTCDLCGKCFMTKINLEAHLKIHEKLKPFICDFCKSEFRTKGTLTTHISLHYGIKPFSCDNCGKSFRLLRQLNCHRKVHTDSYPFVCSYCNKRFRFNTNLKVHIRQHTGERPYNCDACRKDFTNQSNYLKHMKRIHNMDMTTKKYLGKNNNKR